MSEQQIYPKLMAVMADMEAIGKERKNTQQGYNFRGVDDVYNMVQPIMAKHGVVMASTILADSHEERTSKGGGVLIYRILKIRYSFIAADGSSLNTEVIGEGMDSGDKATNKAMSVAQKYAILQMFLIPTVDLKDPENDDPKPEAKNKPVGQVTKPPVEQKKAEFLLNEAQAKEIMEATHYLMTLNGKTEEEMLFSIAGKIRKKFGVELTKVGQLTEGQAAWLIDALYKAVQAEGAKKANEIADKVRGKAAGPGQEPASA